MGARRFTREAYNVVATAVATTDGGDVSHLGKRRLQQGMGLDPRVDPSAYGLIRKSLPRYVDDISRKSFILATGIPMLVEVRFDTTGSMGQNVQMAFDSLPKTYALLAEGNEAVLRRYDPQIIHAIFGDVKDNYVLYRSQAEMDEKIAEQLRLMVPENGGYDGIEDPDYGIFSGTYLTDAFIGGYGLKYYDFTVTDAPCREFIDYRNLVRVFGPTVLEVVRSRGYAIDQDNLPDTRDMAQELLRHAHAFVLQVGEHEYVSNHWRSIYGKDRVVVIPDTSILPYVEAAIIGLTEGVLDLQNVGEYLTSVGIRTKPFVQYLVRQLAGIPLGAQVILPNFNLIPPKGSVFAKKGELWSVENGDVSAQNLLKELQSGQIERDGDVSWL